MQKMSKLKYANYTIAFQEVPNEISLIINVTGCPHKCEGCHSMYLWDYYGCNIEDDLDSMLEQYKSMITCVCFMGGDQNTENLQELLFKLKTEHNLKTCIYSGYDNVDIFQHIINQDLLDYLKIGHFNKELGGLDSPNTNQVYYQIERRRMIDSTHLFQNRNKEQ